MIDTKDIIWTSQFKKDYKSAINKLDIEIVDNIIRKIVANIDITEDYEDIELSNNWPNHRICHIQDNWFLIYCIDNDLLTLIRLKLGIDDLFK